jgi:stearoyl-CoA desaturase (Delta-9 desaturase)
MGSRRYATGDDSRNNPALAVLTFGEGWHNNHHHYQRSARQGFYWWEIDVTYYVLKLLELVRVVRDVEGVPRHVRDGVSRRLDVGGVVEPRVRPVFGE